MEGALYVVLGESLIAISAAIVKWVSETELPLQLIIFYRNFFALFILIAIGHRQGKKLFSTTVLPIHMIRAAIGLSAMYCFFYAIRHISLAQCMTLFLTTPFFIPIIAFIWLKEPIKLTTFAFISIGFVGVLFIINPGTEISPIMLIALFGGFLAGIVKVSLHKLSITDSPVTIVFYFALLATAISLVAALPVWQIPSNTQFLWLILLGVTASIGQLLITKGFGKAPVNIAGPMGFSSILFSALIGWFFWQEALEKHFLLGALLIVGAGIAIVRNNGVNSSPDPEL